jgi:hypothetical protein
MLDFQEGSVDSGCGVSTGVRSRRAVALLWMSAAATCLQSAATGQVQVLRTGRLKVPRVGINAMRQR